MPRDVLYSYLEKQLPASQLFPLPESNSGILLHTIFHILFSLSTPSHNRGVEITATPYVAVCFRPLMCGTQYLAALEMGRTLFSEGCDALTVIF